LYPVFFNEEGVMHSITKFGDYPYIIPNRRIESFDDIFPEWMLLSYNKKVKVSSSADSFPSSHITDEDIRTYWAAQSGKPGEYASLDLGEKYDVYALQINFAEHNTGIFGRQNKLHHQYIIEYSNNNTDWELLIDKSKNLTDNSHDYTQLDEKVNCRYIRINNITVPGGNFAISGFRVFGKGEGETPKTPDFLKATRNQKDRRSVTLQWKRSKNAIGYNICYGINENMMYQNYLVYQDTFVDINSLNINHSCLFSIEPFNENGITSKASIIEVK
jgi:hypothetical protein